MSATDGIVQALDGPAVELLRLAGADDAEIERFRFDLRRAINDPHAPDIAAARARLADLSSRSVLSGDQENQ